MNNIFSLNAKRTPVQQHVTRFKTDRERAAEKNGIALNRDVAVVHPLTNKDVPTVSFKPTKERKERNMLVIDGMQFQPLKQRFKSSTGKCTFDLETQEAYSYGWWRFVERIGPYLVFNAYRYSASTSKHQYQMTRLIEELGLTVDLTIDAPKGLQNLSSAVSYYEDAIAETEQAIAKKGSRKATNIARRAAIVKLQISLATVLMLQRVQSNNNNCAVGF